SGARVKRCGKSAPREAQATRHGKPHRVQGQIGNPGAARSTVAQATGFRVLAAQTNDSLPARGNPPGRQKSAYALPDQSTSWREKFQIQHSKLKGSSKSDD